MMVVNNMCTTMLGVTHCRMSHLHKPTQLGTSLTIFQEWVQSYITQARRPAHRQESHPLHSTQCVCNYELLHATCRRACTRPLGLATCQRIPSGCTHATPAHTFACYVCVKSHAQDIVLNGASLVGNGTALS